MPVYLYKTEDGEVLEVKQEFHEEPLTEIDGKKVRRVYKSPGIVLKGKGFFRNGG